MNILVKAIMGGATILKTTLFMLSHNIVCSHFSRIYNNVMQNQFQSRDNLLKEQNRKLRKIIEFCDNNVPFYNRLFKSLSIDSNSIKTITDLEKLPILTKETIKKNWNDFIPRDLSSMQYYDWSTGGSTGSPLKYRISKYDRFLMGAILYRGMGYGGYKLADKVTILGGRSLNIGKKSFLFNKAEEFIRNIQRLSSFDMGEKEMAQYHKDFDSFKSKFLRGYPSAIYLFACWLEENDKRIHPPKAVFTTSEKLYPNVRKKISEIFNCDVYDNYGINDGGVTAYECSEHLGLHIDTERSILEITNESGQTLEEGNGHIISTTLNNFPMPLIRYDTGDIGHIITDQCPCGRQQILLHEIIGRTADILFSPTGKAVHGWFFYYIFNEYGQTIKEYQVVQEKIDKILIYIVPESNFDPHHLEYIKDKIYQEGYGWSVEFLITDRICQPESGKQRFIVNKIKIP